MILPGSYANGFAPRDGQPLYPELWRGCVVAWCPSLGPTGANLFDWSGFANNGTLNAFTIANAWATRTGKYSLLTDGTNDRVTKADNPSLAITKDLTVSYWVHPLTSGTALELIGKFGAGEVVAGCPWDSYRDTASKVNFRINGSTIPGNSDFTISTGTVPQDTWTHVVLRKLGGEISIWLNGKLDVAESGNGDMVTSTGSLSMGAYPGGTFPLNAYWDDIRVYNRALPANQISLLYSGGTGRSIAYQLAPRKRTRTLAAFRAYWAARKALIQMAGSN